MNYWLISDTHFNHTKLDEWGNRKGDWQGKLLEGIAAIPRDDILIHLGDICIGSDESVHQMLFSEAHGFARGLQTVLVLGNHDKKSKQWYHEHGWGFVCDGLEMIYMGDYLHLTHRPARPQGNTTWNIHGHTHGNSHRSEEYNDFYSPKYHLDISPEIRGYSPLRLDTLLKAKRKMYQEDPAHKML